MNKENNESIKKGGEMKEKIMDKDTLSNKINPPKSGTGNVSSLNTNNNKISEKISFHTCNGKPILTLTHDGKIIWNKNFEEEIIIDDKEMLCIAFFDLINQSGIDVAISCIDEELYEKYLKTIKGRSDEK